MQVDAFLSFTIAVILLLSGKIATMNAGILRRYSIPEPVVGGLLCAAVVALVFALTGDKIVFELGMRDFLLLLFFAGIGLKADVRSLLAGGRSLAILLALAIVFMLIQNFAGLSLASLFGLEPKAGLMVGSISLTGGVGTTLAWAPIFTDRLGIANALELGVAANTVGLISACVVGGPIAAFLMRRHRIAGTNNVELDVGAPFDRPQTKLDYFSVLWAILALNISLMLGFGIDKLIALTGLTVPTFVSCLAAGILIRNLMPMAVGSTVRRLWPGVEDGLALDV